MGDAGKDKKQGELAGALVAEGASDAEIAGNLMERLEDAEDGTGAWIGTGDSVQFAAQQTAKSVDTGSGPGGEVGEGTVFDLAVLAEGFAQQDRRRGVAVGDLRDVHNCKVTQESR